MNLFILSYKLYSKLQNEKKTIKKIITFLKINKIPMINLIIKIFHGKISSNT